MNNLVTLCAVLLVVAACHPAKAYDFQDADFNQLLSSELEDVVDLFDNAPLHHRMRRDDEAMVTNDEKCRKRHRKPKLCCAEASVDDQQQKDKELFKTCFKEVTGIEKSGKPEHGPGIHKKFDLFSCEEVEKRKSDMICIQQCVGQKKGLLTENGSPIADQLANYLRQTFAKDPWIEASVDNIVRNCLAEAKNATENPVKYYTQSVTICDPSGLSLKHCLFKEVQINCPADQIKDKASCERFQERIKKDIDLYGPPPPPLDAPKDDK